MKFQRLEDCEGYTLAKSIIDDNNTLVLKQGTVITSHIILRLKNYGLVNLLVEDPVSDGIDVRSPISDATLIEACRAVDYQNKPAGKDIDVDKVFDVAGKLVNEICENAAIIGNGFQTIKMYDENTSLHSVNVAVMATMFGMSLGYDPRKL
ncbi:MAG: hypothetical protein K6A30_08365, partial [Lachnospiraceae bacterium]|nr:hypothetical protein [Lachnospiraceae bacterium]